MKKSTLQTILKDLKSEQEKLRDYLTDELNKEYEEFDKGMIKWIDFAISTIEYRLRLEKTIN